MDKRKYDIFLPRKDLRTVTLACGLVCTIGLSAALWREANRETDASLEQVHNSTMRLLGRDVDDLRQQVIRAIGDGDARAPLYNDLYFRQVPGESVTVQDGSLSQTPIPIENAGSSVFRASLPKNTDVHVQVKAEGPVPLDENDTPALTGPLKTKSQKVEGTNLTVVASASPESVWFQFSWLVWSCFGIWGTLTIAATVVDRRRAKRAQAAQAWVKNAMEDFRFGRLPPAADPKLMASPEGALVKQLAHTLSTDVPYMLTVSNRMLNQATRLGSWPMFQAQLATLVLDLQPDERLVLGKIHLGPNTYQEAVTEGMSGELAFCGDYVQCMFNDFTLAYALRTRGPDNLLLGVFSPLRHLVENNVLRAGNFEATAFVLNHRSHYGSAEAMIAKLKLDHRPAFGRNLSVPSSMLPHLTLNEGMPAPKVTVFNLIQLLYLDGAALELASKRAGMKTLGFDPPPSDVPLIRQPRPRGARVAKTTVEPATERQSVIVSTFSAGDANAPIVNPAGPRRWS